MSRPALYNVYRPKKFNEVVEQDAIKQILLQEIKEDSLKHVLMFTGPAGCGKAQPLYSKILTPTGWTTMGEIKLNDVVFTARGNLAKVVEIYPQGMREIYEICLSDNSKIRVADNHLNCIYTKQENEKVEEVITTLELIQRFQNKECLYVDRCFVSTEVKKQSQERHVLYITYIGHQECQCIMLDHEDHTYISDDFIPTHNTTSGRIFAHDIEPAKGNVVEINCADHTGVDDVRSLVLDASKTKPLQGKYKIFILDECFYGNTQVSTPNGPIDICRISKGDYVYNMLGVNKVKNVLKHDIPINRLCVVTINGKPIITTKDHLFFTNIGWVEAAKLQKGDIVYGINTVQKDMENMSKLSKTISCLSGEQFQDILLQTMSNSIYTKKKVNCQTTSGQTHKRGTMCNLWQKISCTKEIQNKNMQQEMYEFVNTANREAVYANRIGTTTKEQQFLINETEKSNVGFCSKTKNDTDKNTKWNFTPMDWSEGWKWILYQGTNAIEATLKPGLGFRISGKNRSNEKDISLAYQLQIRPCLSRKEIGDRGGWQCPQIEKRYITRQQKNGMSGNARVESVEIYESTNKSRLLECGISNTEINNGIITMYDLEVEGHPSYFVENTLVHNCHMLTNQAQNALLKVLEEPPAHCIYILCTTDPQKVLSTILSRSFRYDFQLISQQGIIDRLQYICETEKQLGMDGCGIQTWDSGSLELMATASEGHMRNAIATLEKCIAYDKNINPDVVTKVLGVTNYDVLFTMLDCILNKDTNELLQTLENVSTSGMDLKLFIKNFLTFVLDINKYVILKSVISDVDNIKLNIPTSYRQRLLNYTIAHRDKLKHLLTKLLELNSSIKWETNVKPVLETNLLLEVI